MKLRIGAVALVVAAACLAAFAGSASAATNIPGIGQAYCIDGSLTVTTFDEHSAIVAGFVFGDPSGYFTLFEAGGRPDSDDTGESLSTQISDMLTEGGDEVGVPGSLTGDEVPGVVHSVTAGACQAAGTDPPPGIFLCYSADQTVPGVWPQDEAAQLLKQGYWLPYAVSGDATGGTNVGGYNLTCNIASTQSVSDSYVGGDGTVLGPQYAGATIGLYPKVGS